MCDSKTATEQHKKVEPGSRKSYIERCEQVANLLDSPWIFEDPRIPKSTVFACIEGAGFWIKNEKTGVTVHIPHAILVLFERLIDQANVFRLEAQELRSALQTGLGIATQLQNAIVTSLNTQR